jgi:ABC-type sulfate/molybdate transport systems ATPase subunit
VAGFLGAANVLEGQVRGGRLLVGNESVGDAAHLNEGIPARAYVRPHDIRVSVPGNGGPTVEATVERVNNLGWMSKLYLRFSDGQGLIAHIPNEELGPHRPGEQVWVDLRQAKVFDARGEDAKAPAAMTAG